MTLDASFVLNTAVDAQDFLRQKTFLQLIAARFNLSEGNRLSVSVYKDIVEHQIILGASQNNKEFADAVYVLRPSTGEHRLDVAIHGVFKTYFSMWQASPNAKVIVLVVSHGFNRRSDFCPSYVQPFELASQLRKAGVRVIMAVIGVNTSEYFKDLTKSDDEIWNFNSYDDLVSAAGNFSMAVCRTAGKIT